MSLQVEKAKKVIEKKKSQGKPCDSLHILSIAGKESAFIISDMFPITEEYILREYTIDGIPLQIKDQKDINILDKKARKVLALLRKGYSFVPTQPDIFAIETALIDKLTLTQQVAAGKEVEKEAPM